MGVMVGRGVRERREGEGERGRRRGHSDHDEELINL